MRKPNLRIITVLLAVTLCVAALSFTAYADGRDYYAYEPPMETTEPTDPPEPPEPEATPEPPFTPEGNLSLIDDIPYQSKQFITVQSKSGNYFYIIIDRAAEEENVYFLNMVDEADLLALIEEPESEPDPPCRLHLQGEVYRRSCGHLLPGVRHQHERVYGKGEEARTHPSPGGPGAGAH